MKNLQIVITVLLLIEFDFIGRVDWILAEFSICRLIISLAYQGLIDAIDRKWTNLQSWWFRMLQIQQM